MQPPEHPHSLNVGIRSFIPWRMDWILLLSIVGLYLFISLRHLETVPPVYEDEPWQASVAWKLATRGVLGSDMFAGFYGMERHYYAFLPLNPLLTSIVLRIAGLGLFQARLASVLLGMLVLLLTYTLGRRLFNPRVGLLAVACLIFIRTSTISRYDLTGIPLLDIARIHRYDLAVAVFGLAGLHIWIRARERGRPGWYLLAGFLAGLSGLAHLYGIFWLFALLFLALVERVSLRYILALILGFCLPWIPYILFVAPNFIDWQGQTQFYAERFELLDPTWYWHNLTNEFRRYSLGLLPLKKEPWLRVGAWTASIGLPLSLGGLGWRLMKGNDRSALRLLVPTLLLPVLFALLITLKYRHYIVVMLPLFALALAWGILGLWKAAQGRMILQGLILFLLLSVLAEGLSRMWSLEAVARETTPYPAFIARLRAQLPEQARVLGLQRYWLGLHDLDYRAWLVPVYQAHDTYQPLPIEVALEQLNPQVILIDPAMRAYFSAPPEGDDLPERILTWMEQNGFQLVASVDDSTYGKIEVYLSDIY